MGRRVVGRRRQRRPVGEATPPRPASPVRIRNSVLRKLGAATVIAVVAVLHYVLANWPTPVDADGVKVEARAGEELVLIGPRVPDALPVYMGRFGESLDVRFDHARLADTTVALFRTLALDPPRDEGPIAWFMQGAQGTKAQVKLELGPGTLPSNASLRLFKLSNGNPAPNFSLRFADMRARVSIVAPLGDPGADPNPQRSLKIGSKVYRVPGAIPLSFEVPPGATVNMAFSSDPAAWGKEGYFDAFQFRPLQENAGQLAAIPLSAAGVRGQGETTPYALYLACVAAGHLLPWPDATALDIARCAPPEPDSSLRLSTFKVWPDRLELTMNGSAWLAKQGKLETEDLESRLKKNAVFAFLLAALDAALLNWAWKVLTNRGEP